MGFKPSLHVYVCVCVCPHMQKEECDRLTSSTLQWNNTVSKLDMRGVQCVCSEASVAGVCASVACVDPLSTGPNSGPAFCYINQMLI